MARTRNNINRKKNITGVAQHLTPGGYDPEVAYIRNAENDIPLPWRPKNRSFDSFNYKPEDFVDFDDLTREFLEEYGGLQATIQRQGTGEVQSVMSGHIWGPAHTFPEQHKRVMETSSTTRRKKKRKQKEDYRDEISIHRIPNQKYRFGKGWGASAFNKRKGRSY